MIICWKGFIVYTVHIVNKLFLSFLNFLSAFTAKPAFMAGMTRFEQEHDVKMLAPTVTSSSATITCNVEGSDSGYWEAMWIACGH